MHLPHEHVCTLQFLKAILEGQKEVYSQGEQKVINVPMYPELSVEKMWLEAMKIPHFALYVPDEWILKNGKGADRTFFWEILSTLAPEFVQAIVLDVQKQRLLRKEGKKIPPTHINIAPRWMDLLMKEE